MEFKIGQTITINEITYRVSAFVGKYALAVDISKGVVDGGYIPIILAFNEDHTQVTVVTDVEEVKVALRQLLTNGKYV